MILCGLLCECFSIAETYSQVRCEKDSKKNVIKKMWILNDLICGRGY